MRRGLGMEENITLLNVTVYDNAFDGSNVNSTFSEDYDYKAQLNVSHECAVGVNHTPRWNDNSLEDYIVVWSDSIYPSGYSHLRIILISFFVTVIMILIVVGNMLVCIAIATEKSLKTVQNWFIASLAVSDFLVGLIVMPFSLAKEVMGYWIFGSIWCEIHSALDVFLCTASINSLCLISLDRYWSVTHAVEYLKKRTPRRSLAMICFVWVISAVISLPPLVGWKKPDKPTEYPMCLLSDDVGYVLYSAFGSFYIPAFVMVFVYCRIFVAARSRARRHLKKKQAAVVASTAEFTNDPVKDKSTTTTTCTSFSNPSPTDRAKDFVSYPPAIETPKAAESNGTNRPLSLKASSAPEIVIETLSDGKEEVDDGQQVYPLDSPSESRLCLGTAQQQVELEISAQSSEVDQSPRTPVNGEEEWRLRPEMNYFTNVSASEKEQGSAMAETASRGRKASMLRAPKFLKSPFGSTLSLAEIGRSEEDVSELPEDTEKGLAGARRKKKAKVKYQIEELPKKRAPTEAEKQKKRIAKARERRATLILGLIMASFILAWLPFFVLYVLEALCKRCEIGSTGFAIAFWLGYCNSALNPIIYTIFNRDFRKAFRKILFK